MTITQSDCDVAQSFSREVCGLDRDEVDALAKRFATHREASEAPLKEMISKLGENTADAAKEYAANTDRLKEQIAQKDARIAVLEEALRSLPKALEKAATEAVPDFTVETPLRLERIASQAGVAAGLFQAVKIIGDQIDALTQGEG